MPDTHWLIYLLIAAGCTTFFSMFNTPGIRGFRNLGLLATYITAIVMFFQITFLNAIGTWAALGLVSGLLYFVWEAFVYWKATDEEAAPRLGTIVSGLAFWPIMLPEAIEYALAEIGVLSAPKVQERTWTEQEWLETLFGEREVAFRTLPHVLIMSSSDLILSQWARMASTSLGIWRLAPPYSKNAGLEPDGYYEASPLDAWASERNQRELFDWLVQHLRAGDYVLPRHVNCTTA